MREALKRMVVRLLKETTKKIEADTCEMTEEEAMDIMSVLSHQSISKEQACEYMNLRKSQFDNKVRAGELPKGRKRRGFKELVYYKDELDRCKRR